MIVLAVLLVCRFLFFCTLLGFFFSEETSSGPGTTADAGRFLHDEDAAAGFFLALDFSGFGIDFWGTCFSASRSRSSSFSSPWRSCVFEVGWALSGLERFEETLENCWSRLLGVILPVFSQFSEPNSWLLDIAKPTLPEDR